MNTRHKVGGFPTIIIIIVIMGDHHCPTIWRFMQTSSNFSLTGFVYRTRSHVKGFVYCTQPVVSENDNEEDKDRNKDNDKYILRTPSKSDL